MKTKNSKVFEQKGDLLSFKVNIEPKSGLMLSFAESRWAEPSCNIFNIYDISDIYQKAVKV